ncbi:MAG TPA: glutathione S-transferase family protein [Rhizomicrobium sp.]|nr:glutathione S-transferase family protein [Rhizomicrobium sp.]
MKLYTNPASPFGRKCRVIAYELGLKLEEINISPYQDPAVRKINPLGKIPALVLDDGSVLFDSPVICEYLNHAGGGKFFPGMNIFKHSSGRWKALGLQALGDGLADATVTWVLLGREEQTAEKARARQMETILSALAALEKVKFAKDPTIGEIAVACALGYMELRLTDLDWRPTHPNLSGWYAQFCEYPSMKATVPA